MTEATVPTDTPATTSEATPSTPNTELIGTQVSQADIQKFKENKNKPATEKVEAPAATTEGTSSEEKSAAAEPTKNKPTNEEMLAYLKEQGIDVPDIDSLKSKVNNVPLTDEQKAKEAKRQQADLIKFYIENKGGSIDDIAEIQNLQSTEDNELVFNDFAKKQKAKNPNVTPEQIQARFNKQYFINPDPSTLLEDEELPYDAEDITEGENRRKEQAEKLKNNPKVLAYKNAEQEFKANLEITRNSNTWKNEVSTYLDSYNKDLEFDGNDEGTEKVNYKITPEDKKLVLSYLTDNGKKLAELFSDITVDAKGNEIVKTNKEKAVQNLLAIIHSKDIVKNAYKTGASKTIEKHNLAAKNPLILENQPAKPPSEGKHELTQAEREKIGTQVDMRTLNK